MAIGQEHLVKAVFVAIPTTGIIVTGGLRRGGCDEIGPALGTWFPGSPSASCGNCHRLEGSAGKVAVITLAERCQRVFVGLPRISRGWGMSGASGSAFVEIEFDGFARGDFDGAGFTGDADEVGAWPEVFEEGFAEDQVLFQA